MENHQKILVLGRHQFIMEKVVALLNSNGYAAVGVSTDDEALAFIKSNPVDAVVIGGGVENESRTLVRNTVMDVNPEIKVVDAHPFSILSDLKRALS